jgi:CubicO group peptidase (beta-lactamase class C family)
MPNLRRSNCTDLAGRAGALLALLLCSCTGGLSSKHKVAQVLLHYHRDGKFSGAALVGYGNRIVYEGAFGLADESWKIPNTPTTRFQIGSLTKQFTAALALKLAQDGRINLDGRLSAYLPNYRRDVGDAVTIRQLLGHTAGVPDFVHRPDIMQIVKEPLTPSDVVSKYCSGRALSLRPGHSSITAIAAT